MATPPVFRFAPSPNGELHLGHARSALLNPIFRRSNRKIALEDQAILETSWPSEVPPAAQEKSVRTDKPTLAFRKLYFERIKGSSARPPSAAELS